MGVAILEQTFDGWIPYLSSTSARLYHIFMKTSQHITAWQPDVSISRRSIQTIVKLMTDCPSKLVRDKLVYRLHTQPSEFLVRETWRMTEMTI